MVGIVCGNGTGLLNTSASVLGEQGLFGNAATGQNKEKAYVNVANGNLILKDHDDFLASIGVNLDFTRAYNSQGNFNDSNGMNWKDGVRKQITGQVGIANGVNNTVTRIAEDGTAFLFRYDATARAYLSTDGAGPYEAITFDTNTSQWTWRGDRRDLSGHVETYGQNGRILSVSDGISTRIQYAYDSNNQLTSIVDASGDTVYFEYDNAGNLSDLRTLSPGSSTPFIRVRYGYDTQRRLTTVTTDLSPEDGSITDGRTYVTQYAYQGTTNLISSVSQSDGTRQSFSYVQSAGQWKVASVTDALGRQTTFDYSVDGTVVVTDPAGRKDSYIFDTSGQLLEVTTNYGAADQSQTSTYRYTYDVKGNVTTITSPRGEVWRYKYDENGNRILETNPDNSGIEYVFDSVTNLLKTKTEFVGTDNSNLVANGDFSNGLNNWKLSNPNSAVIDYDGSVLLTTSSGSAKNQITQRINGLIPGQTYQLVWTGSTNLNGRPVAGIEFSGTVLSPTYENINFAGSNGSYSFSFSFTALESSGLINLGVENLYGGSYATIKANISNISVKPALDGNLVPLDTYWSNYNNSDRFTLDGKELTVASEVGNYGVSRERYIFGLTPGATYTLSYQVKSPTKWSSAAVYVWGGYGTEPYYTQFAEQDYTTKSVTFVANATNVKLQVYAPNYSSFKDIQLKKADQPLQLLSNNWFNFNEEEGWVYDQGAEKVLAPTDGWQVTFNTAFPTLYNSLKNTTGNFRVRVSLSVPGTQVIVGRNTFTADSAGNLDVIAPLGSYEQLGIVTTKTVVISSFTIEPVDPVLTNFARSRTSELTQRFVYDASGRLRYEISPEGRVTEHVYYGNGKEAFRRQYRSTYNANGLASSDTPSESTMNAWTSVQNAQSDSWVNYVDFSYDGRGQMRSSTTYESGLSNRSPDSTRIYVYDQAGQLRQSFDPSSTTKYTAYAYDGLGRLLSSTDPLGNSTFYTYDDANNTVAVKMANDRMRTSVYDRAGQLVSVKESTLNGPVLGNTKYFYDQDGRLTMTESPNGQRSFKLYDQAGRLGVEIDGDGSVIAYFYNQNGRLTRTRRYANRLPASTLSTFVDANGRPISRVVSDGLPAPDNLNDRNQWNIYDKLGRLSQSVDGTGGLTKYMYDGRGNLTKQIQLEKPVDPAFLVNVNVPTSFSSDPSSDTRTISYFYDGDGNKVGELDVAGYLTEWKFDSGSRQTEMIRYVNPVSSSSRGGSTLASLQHVLDATKDVRIRYLYDGKGQRTGTIDGDSFMTEWVYDRSGNVVKELHYGRKVNFYAGATVANLRPTTAHPDDRLTVYEYNLLNQLTKETTGQTVTTYTYDTVGNLLSKKVGQATVQRRYDVQGRLTAELAPQDAARLEGLTVQAEIEAVWTAYATKHTYDAAGLLISTTDPNGNRTLFYYDTDGRLSFTVNAMGEVSGQTYNGFGQVETRRQYANRIAPATLPTLAGGRNVATFINLAVSLADNKLDTVQNYSYDRDGHTADIVDTTAAGQVHHTATYNEFGEVINQLDYGMADTTNVLAGRDAAVLTLYDKNGQISATMDGAGTVTLYVIYGNVTERYTCAKALAVSATAADLKNAIASGALGDRNNRREIEILNSRGLLARTYVKSAEAGGLIAWTVTALDYDSNGNLTVRTTYKSNLYIGDVYNTNPLVVTTALPASDSADAITRYAYDANNRVTGIATSMGNLQASGARDWAIQTLDYDEAGNIISQRNFAGKRSLVSPLDDLASFRLNGTSSSDAVTRSVYDRSNRLIVQAVYQGQNAANIAQWSVTLLDYDKAGNLKQRTERATTLGEDLLPASATAAQINTWILTKSTATFDDRIIRYGYDNANRLVASLDVLGGLTGYTYDAKGNLTTQVQYAGQRGIAGDIPLNYKPSVDPATDRVTRTIYDRNNRPTLVIDAKGYAIEKVYDTFGNVIKTVEYVTPMGPSDTQPVSKVRDRVQYYVYDLDNRQRFAIDGGGNVTETRYDGLGQVTETRQYPTPYFAAAYSLSGMVGMVANLVAARVDNYTYDVQGNVLSHTNALQQTESWTYDAVGRKQTYTNQLGNTWTYQYDGLGRIIQETAPSVDVYSNGTLDATSWTQAPIHAMGQPVTKYVYDALGNLSSVTSAAGTSAEQLVEYKYDTLGRRTKTIRPSVKIYDAANDPLGWAGSAARVEKDSGPLITTVSYDIFGDAVSTTDPEGNVTASVFDQLGRVRMSRDALNNVTGYEYDRFGNVTVKTEYNLPFGQRLTTLSEMQTAILAAFDDKARVTKFGYDVLGRVVKTTEPLAWVYDPTSTNGNLYLTAAKTTEFEYGEFGAVLSQKVYGSDGTGQQVTEASIKRFYYNKLGQTEATVEQVSGSLANNTAQGYLTRYAYDFAGNLLSVTEYANAYGGWDKTSYGSVVANPAKDRTVSYDYDALNRRKTETKRGNYSEVDATTGAITDFANQNIVTKYDYDAIGNVIAITDAQNNVTYNYYDALSRLKATAKVNTDSTLKPLTEYKYDVLGRQVLQYEYYNGASSATSTSETAVVDAAHDRVSANVFDRNGNLIQQIDANGNFINMSFDRLGRTAKQWRTVTGLDGTVQTTFQRKTYDANGHVTKLTEPGLVNLIDNTSTSAVETSYTFNAFGEATSKSVTTNGSTQLVGYTDYDNAGHAWRMRGGDGVDVVTLFDVRGNATSTIKSGSTTNLHVLKGANIVKASDVLDESKLNVAELIRIDRRYDLMGREVDERAVRTAPLDFLQFTPGIGWQPSNDQSTSADTSMVIVAYPGDQDKAMTLSYRKTGVSDWTTVSLGAASRLLKINGYYVLNTTGLEPGNYDFKTTLTPAGGTAYDGIGGTVNVTAQSTSKKVDTLLALALTVLNRIPTATELNDWMRKLNAGASLSDLALAMITSTDGVAYLSSGGNTAVKNMLSVLGVQLQSQYGMPSPYESDMDGWYRLSNVTTPDNRGNIAVELVLRHGAVLNDQVAVLRSYLVEGGGSDANTAAALRLKAKTDKAGALADATAAVTAEQQIRSISRLYVAVLGRLPDEQGYLTWKGKLESRQITLEQLANNLLTSAEGQVRFPATADQQTQLVRKVYQTLLARDPSTTELNDWLTKLGGTAPISQGAFVLQLTSSVATYAASDAAWLSARTRLSEKVALSLAVMQTSDTTERDATTLRLLADAIVEDGSVKVAIDKTLANLATQANNLRNGALAAATASTSSPVDNIAQQMTRLFALILRRTPDAAGLDYWTRQFNGTFSMAMLEGAANDMLTSTEAQQRGIATTSLSNADFVNTIFGIAGWSLTSSELNDWTAKLANQSRGRLVIDIAQAVLSYPGADSSRMSAKALMANRMGVGLVFAQGLGRDNAVDATAVFNTVNASEVGTAIQKAFDSTAAAALALQAQANTSEQAAKVLAQKTLAAVDTVLGTTVVSEQVLIPARLFISILKRSSLDIGGMLFWIRSMQSGITEASMAQSLFDSAEGATVWTAAFTPNGFLDQFYTQIAGRLPTQAERNTWTPQLTSASQRGQVAAQILRAFINQERAADASTATLTEVKGFEIKVATCVNNLLAQANGATQALSTASSSYQKFTSADASARSQEAAVNTAINNAASTYGPQAVKLVRLYAGVLNRTPDFAGFNFWMRGIVQGTPIESVIASMMSSTEGQALFPPGQSARDFVNKLYANVLNRQMAPGEDFWVNKITVEGFSRAVVAKDFIDSLINNTQQNKETYDQKAWFDYKCYWSLVSLQGATQAGQLSLAQTLLNTSNTRSSRLSQLNAAQAASQSASLIQLLCALNDGPVSAWTVESYVYSGQTPNLKAIAAGGLTFSDPYSFFTNLYSRILHRAPDDEGMQWWLDNYTTTDPQALAWEFYVGAISELNSYRNLQGNVNATVNNVRNDVTASQNAYDSSYAPWIEASNLYNYGLQEPAALQAAANVENESYFADVWRANAFTATNQATADLSLAGNATNLTLQFSELSATSAAASQLSTAASQEAIPISLADAMLTLRTGLQNASTSDRQAIQIVQMYTLLLGRAPTLAEAMLSLNKFSKGMTAVDLANDLINGSLSASLKGLSNEQFVQVLYQNGMNRSPFQVDPAGLNFWVGTMSGSGAQTRAQIVMNMATSLSSDVINTDSRTFDQKVAANTAALAAAPLMDAATASNEFFKAMVADQHYRALFGGVSLTQQASAAIQMSQWYTLLLNRYPDAEALGNGVNQLTSGVAPLTIVQGLLNSPVLQAKFPATMSNDSFIQELFSQGLGRAPTADELAQYKGQLTYTSRAQMVLNLIADVTNDGVGTTGGTSALRVETRNAFLARASAALAQSNADAVQLSAAYQSATALATAASTSTVLSAFSDGAIAPADTRALAKQTSTGPNRKTLDRWGNILSVADERNPNLKAIYSYDQDNHLIAIDSPTTIGAAPESTRMKYDAVGHLVSSRDGRGIEDRMAYDGDGTLKAEFQSVGTNAQTTIKYTVDGLNELVSADVTVIGLPSSSINQKMTYEYDKLGHQTKRTLTFTSPEAATLYDVGQSGEQTGLSANKIKGGDVVVDTTRYDELGQWLQEDRSITTLPNNSTQTTTTTSPTTRKYDLHGNAIQTDYKLTSGLMQRYVDVYDAFGHNIIHDDTTFANTGPIQKRVSKTYTDGKLVQDENGNRTYDAAGHLLKTTNQNGVETLTQSWDYLGHLRSSQRTYDDGIKDDEIRYSYDAAGNVTRETRLAFSGDGGKTLGMDTLRQYDGQGRLIESWDSLTSTDYRQYFYDASGNQDRTEAYTHPNNQPAELHQTISKQFDLANRQLTSSDNSEPAAPVYLVQSQASDVTIPKIMLARYADGTPGQHPANTIWIDSYMEYGGPDSNGSPIMNFRKAHWGYQYELDENAARWAQDAWMYLPGADLGDSGFAEPFSWDDAMSGYDPGVLDGDPRRDDGFLAWDASGELQTSASVWYNHERNRISKLVDEGNTEEIVGALSTARFGEQIVNDLNLQLRWRPGVSDAYKPAMLSVANYTFGNALGSSLASQSPMSDVDRALQQITGEDLKGSARFASSSTGDLNTRSDVPTYEELTLASARGVTWNEALGSQPHDYQTYDGEVGTDAEGLTITRYTRHTSRGYDGGEVQNPSGVLTIPGSDNAAPSSDLQTQLDQLIADRFQQNNARIDQNLQALTRNLQNQISPIYSDANLKLSGASWVNRFPTSRSLNDLNPSFRKNVSNFIGAINNAGGHVNISATYRPPERAYLMHYSSMIARGEIAPQNVPQMNGVSIKWVHPTPEQSVRAAKEMANAYDIVYPPALTSRHTAHDAIDMRITGMKGRDILDANGNSVRITTLRDLNAIGASYGVIKLASDPPHWSNNGH